MPVDNNQNIEAEYLNDSWAMMHELLDKELPLADNKPKPPSKNWLTAILVLLFAWTTYLYWPQDFFADKQIPKQEQEQQQDETYRPIASVDQVNSFEISTKDPARQLGEDRVTTQVTGSDLTKPSNQELIYQKKEALDQVVSRTLIIPSIAENTLALNNEVEGEVEKFSQNLIEYNSLEVPTSLDARNDVLKSKTISHTDFGVTDPNANKKYWSASLKFEGILDRSLPSGNFFGFQLTRQLSNQFALQVGLGLSRYKKLNPAENSFDTFSDVLGMEISSNEDDQSALNAGLPIKYDDRDDKVSVIGINKVNYLTIPLELTFALNRKMGVVVGAGISYLISAEFSDRTNDYSWTSHDNGKSVNNEELLGTALNRLDIAPSIGLLFRPIDRLAFDLKFRNGLIDISRDKFLGFQEFHSNKYLHLGVTYDIIKF